jgi:hypothetical protein
MKKYPTLNKKIFVMKKLIVLVIVAIVVFTFTALQSCTRVSADTHISLSIDSTLSLRSFVGEKAQFYNENWATLRYLLQKKGQIEKKIGENSYYSIVSESVFIQ